MSIENIFDAWLKNLGRPPAANETLVITHDNDFIDQWFATGNSKRKLDLALAYGLVKVRDDWFFEPKNSMARNFDLDRLRMLAIIYWRDSSYCAYCSKELSKFGSSQGVIDHVIPRSAWPKEWLWLADDGSNLVASCIECNQKKSFAYQSIKTEARLLPIKLQNCLANGDSDFCETFCSICELVEGFCSVHEECLMPRCAVNERWSHNGL